MPLGLLCGAESSVSAAFLGVFRIAKDIQYLSRVGSMLDCMCVTHIFCKNKGVKSNNTAYMPFGSTVTCPVFIYKYMY